MVRRSSPKAKIAGSSPVSDVCFMLDISIKIELIFAFTVHCHKISMEHNRNPVLPDHSISRSFCLLAFHDQ